MALWLGAVLVGTGIAGLRGALPGVEPKPYIIRFTEDRPEPALSPRLLHVRLERGDHLRRAEHRRSRRRHRRPATGISKQIYRTAYFPLAGSIWLLGALGQLPRVKASTKGEGHERRYFYGSVWAVCWAQPALWLMWKVLPHTRRATRSSSWSSSAFSRLSATSRASAGCRARARSCPASWPSPTELARAHRVGLAPTLTARDKSSGRPTEGWQGWDEYAPFYDWENARTLGRRDVPFWRRVALEARGPVLELGCGTGRMSLPLARAGVKLVGIDRSAPMLARASQARRPGPPLFAGRRPRADFVRGDIRALPFADARVPDGARAVRHPAVAAPPIAI